jgi:uncharacterized protein YyaL (SSP411 family)
MTSVEGGFYSATDADSEGIEGKFFVWSPGEVQAVLTDPEDARRFCVFYDVTPAGNWEHTNVLNRPKSDAAVAQELGITEQELRESLARARPILYAARAKRVPPGLDDKIITAWNGMMISSMAEAGRVFGEERYAAAARGAADFILGSLTRPDGGLYRTYREGKAHLDGYLEDYAYLVEALIDLYESGAEERYLTEAARLADRMVADFADEEQGGFFTTARAHESLIIRSREGPDGATPSGNAVAASGLARRGFLDERTGGTCLPRRPGRSRIARAEERDQPVLSAKSHHRLDGSRPCDHHAPVASRQRPRAGQGRPLRLPEFCLSTADHGTGPGR